LYDYALQMANIEVLKEYAETGESTHVMFKMASVEDRSNVQKSFEQINPDEVIAFHSSTWHCFP